MQRQKMPWIGHNPSMRIARIRTFWLRALVLAALGTLALAGSAYASELPEAGGAPAEQELAGTDPGPAETSEGGGAVGGEVGKEAPPPEEAKEAPPEEAKQAPPPEEAKQAPPPEESMPTVTVLGEGAEVTPAAVGTEEAPKATHAGSEEGPEGGGSAPARSPLGADSAISPAHTGATEESPASLLGLPTSPPTARGPETQDSGTAAVVAVGARAAMTAAQRAGTLSCELAALGGSASDNCTVGWLGGKRIMSSTAGPTHRVSFLTSATTGLSGGGGSGHGGSAVGNAPVSPAPGPAPGGASGAAVGGGAPGGGALSIFLTLAGLLLLAGPRAMRRLRLSCEPWLTACFVLIPERPG